MKRIFYLLSLGVSCTLPTCVWAQSDSGTDANPRIMGSNNIPQSYYDKARQAVPPALGVKLSTDPGYGITQKQPVCVGDKTNPKTRNVFGYLNALRGPQGQEISYRRMGSCCPFKTPNGIMDGMALLNAYEVTWANNPKPMILYINNYDEGPLATPSGLTLAKP